MSAWVDNIIRRFPATVSHLWIATDPDDVLLDEQLIESLGRLGFDLLDFDDPIAFRAEYEAHYRPNWDVAGTIAAPALILRYRRHDPNDLPWDYVNRGRHVRLSLAELFPNLSYNVVKSLDPRHLAQLYDAYKQHASQPLGDAATKDFLLTHIFKISAFLISRDEDLWRELLRCYYNDQHPPALLTERITETLAATGKFKDYDLSALWSSKVAMIDALQQGWRTHLKALGAELTDEDSTPASQNSSPPKIPFSHPDVRTFVDSMFLDGELHPIPVSRLPEGIPQWVRLGISVSEQSVMTLVEDALRTLEAEIPPPNSSHRDWISFAGRYAELLKRYHLLDFTLAKSVEQQIGSLRARVDDQLAKWLKIHYSTLPSLPVANGPVVLGHIPRFLEMKRGAEGSRLALLVFDGMAIDQWRQIKDHLARSSPQISCEEMAVFAWLPTLTSICRQSIFSGLKPREFADSIDSTGKEESLWSRFWIDRGLRKSAIVFAKGLKRNEDLVSIADAIAGRNTTVMGLVVDSLDELVHGAVFGKRGISGQIGHWLETGFVDQLLITLLDAGFQVYVTSDHGNTDAIGIGRPRVGETSELRGERTRVYRSEPLRSQALADMPGLLDLDFGSLPADFLPVFAPSGKAFVGKGEQIVSHGGASLEELLVPFVRIAYK